MMTSVVGGCVVVCLSVGCMSPVMQFGAGKSARQAQHETMSDLAPVQLETASKWGGEITTRKIRVWADDQYRAQNVRWQRSFEAPIELANLVLTSLFGVRLAPEYHAWERHVAGSTIAADLEALAERDPGRDVLLVVGLTSSLPLVSATFDELGYASVGGSHLIVRGYADLEERKLYADAFRDLLPEERELSLEARRHHKTAVVLLHEIGHTFGADHDADQDTIMNASYSHRAGSFSTQARDVMLRTIDRRLGRASTTGEVRETTAATKPPPRPSGPHRLPGLPHHAGRRPGDRRQGRRPGRRRQPARRRLRTGSEHRDHHPAFAEGARGLAREDRRPGDGDRAQGVDRDVLGSCGRRPGAPADRRA
jgi:hypothetical protein